MSTQEIKDNYSKKQKISNLDKSNLDRVRSV
jgi:hypothetical protein